MLLGRPHPAGLETVNDRDAYVANVFRALQGDPAGVARWCDRPPNEADLHASHVWLVTQRATFTARLMGDPDYYDAQVAGRWLYGIACHIGGEWCSGRGPWQSVEGRLVQGAPPGGGISRQRLHLSTSGQGIHRRTGDIQAWFTALQARLRYVRVCCGDWERVCRPNVTVNHGLTALLFDPPYSASEGRQAGLYGVDDLHVAHGVRAWCLARGADPRLRLVLCGYGTVHDALLKAGWMRYAWLPSGGYGSMGDNQARRNKRREILWASPACLAPAPRRLVGG